MFSLDHPAILSHLGRLAYGFQPVRFPDGHFCLILKLGKEFILTARVNDGFKIYLVPDLKVPYRSLGFITAFFDDHDEPLVLFTPLYAGDDMLHDLIAALCQDRFDLFFFDEHDREFLGASSHVSDVELFRQSMADTQFPTLDANDDVKATYAAMKTWFGLRVADDDARAFAVELRDRLYPDDLVLIDARDEAYDFQCSEGRVAVTSLEREEPGAFQERDIVALLRRAFRGEAIFLNPMREDSGTELTDVLVVTDEVVLLVQAKDSPNTRASLFRSIDRKRAVIRSHIDKAAKQLRGALAHILGRDEIILRTAFGPRAVDVSNRAICGLVVVREMFEDDYRVCSASVLAVAHGCKQPCVLLDYPALHVMALHLPSPARLINGFLQLFEVALEHGEYPKPRFSMPPQY
jgi:hypothetical protein